MQMNPMCSISEVVGQHQRRAGNANITPEQQGRPQSPATQSRHTNGPTNTPEQPHAPNGIKSTVRKRQWVVLVAWAKVHGAGNLRERKKLEFQLDMENLELVQCGDSTAWCLGQPEHPIKVKESGDSSGRLEVFRIEDESHKMIQTMDNYSG